MAFSNASDARTKLTNPYTDNSSEILYANNDLLDSTTIFYKNSAKTILASAGNYVVVTNYKTYFITLGSDAKITGTKSEVMPSGSDSTWVEDRLKNGDALISNQLSVGGTSLSISGDFKLTDAVWSSRPYSGSKAWMIEHGDLNTTAITNIDLSDMRGYDLRLITGEYTSSKFVGTGYPSNTTSAIIHLESNPSRSDIIGNKKYFFRPDYWIPSTLHNTHSYFRRMPDIEQIFDKNGMKKMWVDMAEPLMDIVNASTHTARTSTRLNKGITEARDVTTAWGVSQNIDRNKHLFYEYDDTFKSAVARAWDSSGVPATGNFLDDIWQHKTTALFESLDVSEANKSTWRYTRGGYDWSYYEVNKYEFTTAWASGTNYQFDGPASQYTSYFYPYGATNGVHIEYDFEVISPALFSEIAGINWNKCINSAKAVAEQVYSGFQYPKFSIYGLGIYQSINQGASGYGWKDMKPGNTITGTQLYSDYHDYFVNGTIPYTSLGSYKAWFKGAIENFGYFYVSNYQLDMDAKFQIYSIVHNTDITRKILFQILGAGHNKKVCGYFWYKQEIVSGTSDYSYQRKVVTSGGGQYNTDRNRLEASPSMMYNMAVWSMTYADGLYFWYQAKLGEETGAARTDGEANSLSDGAIETKWGETWCVGKSSYDWAYIGYLHASQNKDIIGANTDWKTPNYKIDSTNWTSGTQEYPVSLFNQSRPISKYKLSADGTEALVIIYNGFNNGYTKVTHTLRLPDKANYQFTVDTFGSFTTILRLSGL